MTQDLQEVRSLPDLVACLSRGDSFQSVLQALHEGQSGTIDGAWGSSSALVVAAIARQAPGSLLVVLPRISQIDDFTADLDAVLHGPPDTDRAAQPTIPIEVFPAWESLPSDRSVSDEVFGARLRVLRTIEQRPDERRIIVASIASLLQPVPPRADRERGTRVLKRDHEIDVDELLRWLVDRGFERVPAVEVPGEFSVHGGIIDIFPADLSDPVRIELFGDEIESIRYFDVETQRRIETIDSVLLTAVVPTEVASELNGDIDDAANLLDSLDASTWISFGELEDVAEEGKQYLQRLDDARGLFTVQSVFAKSRDFSSVSVAAIGPTSYETTCHLQIESIERFSGARSQVLEELASAVARDESVLIACHNAAERERLEELLAEENPEFAQRVMLTVGTVTRGYRLVSDRIVVLSDNELFNRVELHRQTRRTRRTESRAIDSFLELNEGDLVVHLSYGIGRFLRMELLEREEGKEEHLVIEFRDSVKIYVPVTLIHLVQKYVGASKGTPRLSKVGSAAWARNKKKVAAAVSDMAADMLRLQAARASQPGFSCPPDSHWQQEFESSFPYVETPDQRSAIEECRHDLQQPRPMDRLICGDVGFGKTEVAMRAAFKMVDAGRQVAVLVPTTVLAEQHFRSFSERMAEFPISMASISRYKTKREQREILEGLAAGTIDIVIGTHRLVQQDVGFRNLGLIVIDEEQRFGVEAKDMLKRMRLSVDVLTLSATPIPRTLHLSLLGIRDISNLTTPPQDRVSIETRICRWDGDLIRSAIVRELNRSGQIYFVHNRVYDIQSVADRVQQIVPEARIAIVHGQMTADELEQGMLKFVSGKADILVATTIIESGLDIPNANTMFINEAENYGLADLHQLRGRVGRFKHRAYCYLLVGDKKPIQSAATRRLKAIEEFSELGAGFKIAMRDLEIRGAGNILGTEQSGHISTVGYELYCQLLENAVRSLKKMPLRENPHVNLDLPITAYLPSSYVPSGRHKIEVYRKLSAVATLEEHSEMCQELEDRYGPIPAEAGQFLSLKELELRAYGWGIDAVRLEEDRFAVFTFREARRIPELVSRVGSDLRHVDEQTTYLLLPKRGLAGPELVEFLKSVLQ